MVALMAIMPKEKLLGYIYASSIYLTDCYIYKFLSEVLMKYCVLTVLLAVMFFSSSLLAKTINCGNVEIKTIYVQGDRGDNSFHENKLLISMGNRKQECNDFEFAYLDITDEAYNGTLALAMAAYMAGKTLRIQVKDMEAREGAKKIAWVNF